MRRVEGEQGRRLPFRHAARDDSVVHTTAHDAVRCRLPDQTAVRCRIESDDFPGTDEARLEEGQRVYGRESMRRRREVARDAALRDETIAAACRFHELVAKGETPRPQLQRKCANCSLRAPCLPELGTLNPREPARALRHALGVHT